MKNRLKDNIIITEQDRHPLDRECESECVERGIYRLSHRDYRSTVYELRVTTSHPDTFTGRLYFASLKEAQHEQYRFAAGIS